MDPYIGKMLDNRYEILELIGRGGMANVYKAKCHRLDRLVAVKILHSDLAQNADFRRRFMDESRAVAQLSHPNIVSVYDVSCSDDVDYIVMELIDGVTLKQYMERRGQMDWREALHFITQIMRGLSHAHSRGVIHRDIKPQNIMVLRDGSVKVADFGIACLADSAQTLTQEALGSVHYISPEQARGDRTDARSDIYSAGVVLYEMLAGRVPFDADSAVSVALMQVQADAKRLIDINPDIPRGVEQICAHAMEKNPANRYQSATEMLFDVEEVIKNPATTFDYSYFVDEEPTKYVIKTVDHTEKHQPDLRSEPEQPVVEEDPKRKGKIVGAVIAGMLVLAAAIVLLVMGLTGSLNTKSMKLENFVGQSYDTIVSSNQYDYVFVQESKESEDADPGTVLEQKPAAGERVMKGSTVTLVVAQTPGGIQVPNCYGLGEDMAKKELASEGLNNYTVTTISSETVKEGQCVYTSPKAGDLVAADQTVTIYISSGPSTTQKVLLTVPDVRGLSQSDARNFMEKSGFENVQISTEDSNLPKDTVISQTPGQGEAAEPSATIKLVVSTGVVSTDPAAQTVKLQVTVPDTGKHSTLNIYVDGELKFTKSESLDGGQRSFNLQVSYGARVEIEVELGEVSQRQTVKADKAKTVRMNFNDKTDTTVPDGTD